MQPDQPPREPVPILNYAPPPAGTDLRTIAMRQKVIIYCILGYLIFGTLQFTAIGVIGRPTLLFFVSGFVGFGVMVVAAIYIFMLALSLYGRTTGVILGILTLIPLIGLLVLLRINSEATGLLRRHGIHVGLMGARSNQIPAPGQLPLA